MANLRRRARRDARLQYRPVLRGIRQQKGEARQLYRSSVRGERQAAGGISNAALAAVPQIRRDYRRAQRELNFADRLGGDASGPIADADAMSDKVFRQTLAEALAGSTTDMRQRAVRAQEAAAYGERAARGTLAESLAGLSQEAQATRREMGQFATSRLSDLRDARADRRLERRGLELDEAQFAEEQRQNRIGNRLDRRRLRLDERGESSSREPDTVHSQDIKSDVLTLAAEYKRRMARGQSMADIAKMARRNKWKDPVIDAASSLASKGYIPSNGLETLREIGVRHIPKDWRTPGSSGGGGLKGFLNRVGA